MSRQLGGGSSPLFGTSYIKLKRVPSILELFFFDLYKCYTSRKVIASKNVGGVFISLVSLEIWHRIFIDQEPGWVDKGSNLRRKDFGNSITYV